MSTPAMDESAMASELWEVAKAGHTAQACKLLDEGAPVNWKNAAVDGATALVWAASEGHTDTVELLLDCGADPEAKDRYGATALVRAAWRGHTDTVELLLDCGADPEAKDRYGRTAPVWAASEGHTDTVELLLDCGADLEAKDRYGRTAPVWAASEGHTDTVELLLDRGADLEATNNTGKNALALCTNGACAEVLRSAERLQRWHRRRQFTLWACTLGMIEI